MAKLKNRIQVGLTLPPYTLQDLREVSEEIDRPVTQIIEDAINKWLKGYYAEVKNV